MSNVNDTNWLEDLFIDEAKPAMNRHSGGGAPSWNDLPDKPFYEEANYTVIANEQQRKNRSPILSDIPGHYNNKGWLRGDKIIKGETYMVTVDGVDYEGVAQCKEGSEYPYIFGTGALFDMVPVNLMVTHGQTGVSVTVRFADGNQHSIKITHVQRNIKTIETKYLPEHMQFYEKPNRATVVPATTVEFSGEPAIITANLKSLLDIKHGDTIYVSWNGENYTCVAMLDDENNAMVWGNAALAGSGENTGEPFVFAFSYSQNMTVVVSTASESVTMEVTMDDPIIHPIDPKFIGNFLPVYVLPNVFTLDEAKAAMRYSMLYHVFICCDGLLFRSINIVENDGSVKIFFDDINDNYDFILLPMDDGNFALMKEYIYPNAPSQINIANAHSVYRLVVDPNGELKTQKIADLP